MNVNVRLFAGLHQMVGKREIILDIREGATVRQLRERLGEEYVPGDYVLQEGDMVALIPPVSGG